jgi:DNA adenine methylase
LGGASLYFAALPAEAVLSDLNPRLIEAYQVLRDQPNRLIDLLAAWDNDEPTYYDVRRKEFSGFVERAAQFIFLNRTCWNGLYRVNRDGKFNVPFGNHGRQVFDEGHLLKISHALQSAKLRCGDFEKIVENARSGDFVFFDPPYTTLHARNGFRQYNEKLFSWSDQQRLGRSAVALARRGCNVVVSNASYEPVLEFYPGFDHQIVSRHSILAADPKHRRATTEFLIYSPGI